MLKLLWVMIMKCRHCVKKKCWDHCFYLEVLRCLNTVWKGAKSSLYFINFSYKFNFPTQELCTGRNKNIKYLRFWILTIKHDIIKCISEFNLRVH